MSFVYVLIHNYICLHLNNNVNLVRYEGHKCLETVFVEFSSILHWSFIVATVCCVLSPHSNTRDIFRPTELSVMNPGPIQLNLRNSVDEWCFVNVYKPLKLYIKGYGLGGCG